MAEPSNEESKRPAERRNPPRSLNAKLAGVKAQREEIERGFILKAIADGLSVKAMARKFHCKAERIRRVLKREGVVLPSQIEHAWDMARRENLSRLQGKAAEVEAMNAAPKVIEPPAPKPAPCDMCGQKSLDLKKVVKVLARQDESMLCPSCYAIWVWDEVPTPQTSNAEPKPAPKFNLPMQDIQLSEDEREANRLRYERFIADSNESFVREQQEIARKTATAVRRSPKSLPPFGIYKS